MPFEIKQVGVIGSGTMGSGIAALLAGVGVPVIILDIPAPGTQPGDRQRDAVVAENLKKLGKAKPPQLFEPEDLDLLQPGNTEDDLERLADCDWIIEVIVEKLPIKQALMARLEAIRKPNAIISTNTSGLSIKAIAEGRSPEFQRHFLGTHFFNPPRYLKLLEIIPHANTDPAVLAFMLRYGAEVLGKGCVVCKDTPNFIGNRFMSISGMLAVNDALEHGFSVEEVDALTGPVIGRPKSGTFRLNDVVGVDVAKYVADNLYAAIPDDPWREVIQHPGARRVFDFLLEDNHLGNKTGQGFYKTVKGADGGKEFWHLDLHSLDYVPPSKPRFESVGKHRKVEDTAERLRLLLNEDDRAAQYLWRLHANLMTYAAQKLGEITDDLVSIDNAQKWGFGHELGPFEIWDALGVAETVERLSAEGFAVPDWVREMLASGHATFYQRDANGVVIGSYSPRSGGYQPLQRDPRAVFIRDLRASGKGVHQLAGASLLDMGDGVALLEFHSKMNAIDPDVVAVANLALARLNSDFDALVIGNQGDNFSVGANLGLIGMAAGSGAWDQAEAMIAAGQQVTQRLRYAPKPVVTAPFAMCLGGGAEFAMAGWRAVAHAESYMGLVELGVGLVPAWGGCKELLRRLLNPVMQTPNADPLPHLQKIFEQIGTAKVSGSAFEARSMGFLSRADRIVMNRDHLLHEAKQTALALVQEGATNGEPGLIYAAGRDALAVLRLGVWQLRAGGYASDYDQHLGNTLAYILTGGDLSAPQWVPEQYILDLEREAILALMHEAKTMDRVTHMLSTGKPLRN
ncbi:MAG: 3-hydroxyacyl-CoA dehydrogenase/enoyl-CoA hydratase family protein [Anaerolineae bacterium]|nr:3-hydroxyacyl-CoA dehydrogenase/enoyl-CoA hydratase family protein [Anaerolineae bacterium]